MMAHPDIGGLVRCLSHPVRRGWLDADLAEAVVLSQALRFAVDVDAAIAAAAEAQAALRRAVAA